MVSIKHTTMRSVLAVLALLSVAVYATPSSSQTPTAQHTHGDMNHSQMGQAVVDLYAPAMKEMHDNMVIAPTGNADVDFMRGMIPHHQGAIEMAKIVLAHGKDPEVRKLAQDVIRAQESEIAFMREWLAKNAK